MTHASNDFHTVPQPYQDILHSRIVQNNVVRIEEHLEAMQRDPHGLEFGPWKMEVDETWKSSFDRINKMGESSQRVILESIREIWVNYITHYGAVEVKS